MFFVVQSPLVWGSGAPNAAVRNARVGAAQAFVLPGIDLLRVGTPDRPGQTEKQRSLLSGLTDCPRASSVLQNECGE